MFSDILETSIIYNASVLTEAANELIVYHKELFESKPPSWLKIESADEDHKKSIIRRAIDSFKKYMGVIIEWIKNLIAVATEKITAMLNKLRGIEVESITIAAPANIKKIDSIRKEVLTPSMQDVLKFKLDDALSKYKPKNEDSMAKMRKELSGYVKTLSKYDGLTPSEISVKVLGQKSLQKDIDTAKLAKHLTDIRLTTDVFNKFVNFYSHTIINTSQTVTDEDLAEVYSHITSYYTRNITAVSTLLADSIMMCTKAIAQIGAKVAELKKQKEANK